MRFDFGEGSGSLGVGSLRLYQGYEHPHLVTVTELLHRQIDGNAPRTVLADGIAASPGAATGKLVFDSATAQSYAARGEGCSLVRRETSPEDFPGMVAARGIGSRS